MPDAEASAGWWRPLAAAAVALGALALAGANLHGPLSSFAQGLPVVVLCGTWLARTTGARAPRMAALAAGALMVAPALGYRSTRMGIDRFEAGYLLAENALHSVLVVASFTPRGTGPLLLAAGLAAVVGLGRGAAPAAGAALGGGVGARIGQSLLDRAAEAWLATDYGLAARLSHLAGWMGLLAMAGGLAGVALARWQEPVGATPPAELRRVRALLSTLVVLACGWAATPPLELLLRALPPAMTGAQAVQRLPTGRSFAAPALGPEQLADPEALSRYLSARRLRPMNEGPWPCTPLPPIDWVQLDRNAVIVPLPPEAPVSALATIVPTLLRHAVYDMVLPGRGPPLPGPLGGHARWSGQSFLLDRPPEGVLWIAADHHGWQVVSPAPWFDDQHAVCALLAAPDMSIGELTQLGRTLAEPGGGGPCQDALALVPFWPEQDALDLPPPEGCAAVPPRPEAPAPASDR